MADLDEPALAAQAAAQIRRRLRGLPAEVAARRLAAALGRRGFGADVIRRALEEGGC